MKRIAMAVFLLASLGTAAEAHRLAGTATYYGGGDGFCGRQTASGVRFNCKALTAAHRTLPFGTVLSVRNRTGKTVNVVVNDRGPFTKAFLDLSPAAAALLGCRCTHHGVTASVVSMGNGATFHHGKRRAGRKPAHDDRKKVATAQTEGNPFAALFQNTSADAGKTR